MIDDQADEVIESPFESLIFKYWIELETPMTGSGFIFD